jgi:hypothetical protein
MFDESLFGMFYVVTNLATVAVAFRSLRSESRAASASYVAALVPLAIVYWYAIAPRLKDHVSLFSSGGGVALSAIWFFLIPCALWALPAILFKLWRAR